jgi:hypothetical protein
MLPKFWSFVCPIIRSFVHSFIVPIHCSSLVHSSYSSFVHGPYSSSVRSFVQTIFVQPLCYRNSDCSSDHSIIRPFIHSSYSSFIVRSYELFTFTIHHRYCSSLLFINVTIQRFYSPLLFIIVTIHRWYLWLLFHHHYSSLLFIDRPINPNFNYSSIMLSSSPKTYRTNIPVIQTSVTVIFLPVRTTHMVTHPRFLQVEQTVIPK